MTNIQPKALELIKPTNPMLNTVIKDVTPEEIGSSFIDGVIARMLELSAGKGHSKHDTRQMVGLAASQLGVNKKNCNNRPYGRWLK